LTLITHEGRYDLPKGHRDEGETSDLQSAYRELGEETGLLEQDIELCRQFSFETVYYPRYKRFNNERVGKKLVIFLGVLNSGAVPRISDEHENYQWISLQQHPSDDRNETFRRLLPKVRAYFQNSQNFASPKVL